MESQPLLRAPVAYSSPVFRKPTLPEQCFAQTRCLAGPDQSATRQGAAALAEAGTIATILPGCKFILGTGPWPQAGMLKDAGCEVAIATDSNPGSCPLTNLPLCAFIAVSQCGLTLEEALWGITQGGALALGLHDRGRLFYGKRADFLILNHRDWRKVFYTPDVSSVEEVWISGELI